MCSSVKQYTPCGAALEQLLATGVEQAEVSGSGTLILHQHSPCTAPHLPALSSGKVSSRFQGAAAQLLAGAEGSWVFAALPEGDGAGASALSLVTALLRTALISLWGAVPGCCTLTARHITCCSHALKHRHFIFFKLVFLSQCLQAHRAPVAGWDTRAEGEQPWLCCC